MKLRIQAVDHCDREALRALLIDAADQLTGMESCLLEPKLPWDGHPILLADAEGHPVLVSFDIENSQAALLNGLHASDQLAVALPWVNQIYTALKQQQKPPRLVVVTAEPPPGNEAALTGNQALRLFTCRVLRINEDTGLLLEPLNRELPTAVITAAPSRVPQAVPLSAATGPTEPMTDKDPAPLSDQEIAYFQQL